MTLPAHDFRSRCSIARTLEIVGDKWTLLIVRDLMWHGKHTFQELQNSDEHMPSNLLSLRLKRLMTWGLVRRDAYQDRPTRYKYYLSGSGKSSSRFYGKSWDGGMIIWAAGFIIPINGVLSLSPANKPSPLLYI